jgi:phage-related protein
MAVFDWVESPGTQLSEEPVISSTRFGDGYEERAPAGLNPVRQEWNLQFRAIDSEVADAIVAFLRARVSATLGLEAFDWTPLWATTAIRVTCKAWNRSHDETPGESTVVATFRQVFE